MILSDMVSSLPTTLGALRREVDAGRIRHRSVRSEIRENLMVRLKAGGPIFPGIVGYDDTVIPQVVNAILSRHNFILLGLRGQAKTRLLRSLTILLDEVIPVVPGSEINDNPLAPLSAAGRARVQEEGDDLPIAWLPRENRYIEKLATPDVTIADMVGDIDPIKAARTGLQLGNELTMHYGLLPRANRCIFAINELPDLAGRIQVGLFNILQEGDIQIKGYPVRLPLDLMICFTANPEDYTARGKIITPLKDRIGSEIRTHYPTSRADAMSITEQEAWASRDGHGAKIVVPTYVREVIEEVAFQARTDPKIDKRSGVSQRLPISCLENVVSNAERRALTAGETDRGAAHRRHLRGAAVDHRQVRTGIRRRAARRRHGREGSHSRRRAQRLDRLFPRRRFAPDRQVVRDGRLAADERRHVREGPARSLARGAGSPRAGRKRRLARHIVSPALASAIDFALEGLSAQKKISRTDEWRYQASEQQTSRRPAAAGRRGERWTKTTKCRSAAREEEVLQLGLGPAL